MKALPTIASHRGRLDAAGDLIGGLRLSYEEFMFLAILGDACAIVLASIAAGGIYHWISFGTVASLSEFVALGGILAALTAPAKAQGPLHPRRLAFGSLADRSNHDELE